MRQCYKARWPLGYLLNHYGMIKSEATVANLPASDRGPARVWYGSAAESETHDLEWLTTHVRDDEDVHIKSLTNDQTILVLTGPKARDVLSGCARGDWSQKAFPWLSVREAFVGFAPSTVLAVSFSGELAYEIHVPNASLYAAYLGLREAGKAHGMQLFGARAVNAMRIEKGFLHWKADLLTEFDPFETGLDRFVKLEKGDFVGRDALIRRQAKGSSKRLVTLEIATITSGEWGHRVGKNLAYAFVNLDVAEPDVMLEVDMCGLLVSAKVIQASPYDSSHQLMRR